MKSYIIIFFVLIIFIGCQHKGEKKPPASDYVENLWEYENFYDADNRLEKVICRQYLVIAGLKLPQDSSRTFYTYRFKDKDLVSMIATRDGEVNTIQDITNYSPDSEEIITIEGKDTTFYELKVYDTKKRLIKEIQRFSFTRPDEEIPANDQYENYFFFDNLGRLSRKISCSKNDNGYKSHNETIFTYKDTTEIMLSEHITDKLDNEIITYNYIAGQSGDTLIQEVRNEGQLIYLIKKTSEYSLEEIYDSGLPIQKEEKITKGTFRTEISWDVQRNIGDSIYYEADKVIKKINIIPEYEASYFYTYDNQGNLTEERQFLRCAQEGTKR